jgi:hypothetical protein
MLKRVPVIAGIIVEVIGVGQKISVGRENVGGTYIETG